MSLIRVLPETLRMQIAAGEVIERPASAVKELVENSVDAGATHIRVLIERAGVKLIRVSDNGSGMDEDDALMCFELHGTSKIQNSEDLFSVGTYGFRGEALASMASVSRMTLRTRQTDASDGTEVVIEGGKLKYSAPAGCASGTEFSLRDLFYNVPARRKFLKTDATEERHIFETVMNMALPNCECGFELYFDGKEVLHSPGSKTLIPRLQSFFGKNITRDLMPIDHTLDGITIKGWIARHGVTRPSRKEQRVFVNGRTVDSLSAYQGIKEGYGSMSGHTGYPPAVLFIELDPNLVDVNVHPAKREIRFRNERKLIQTLETAIRSTLQSAAAPASAVGTQMPLRSILKSAEIIHAPATLETPELPSRCAIEGFGIPAIQQISSLADSSFSTSPRVLRDPMAVNGETTVSRYISPSPDSGTSVSYAEPPKQLSDTGAVQSLRFIGVLNETYILASLGEGLVVIDQHAAHERVLFERLMRQAKAEKGAPSQALLIPVPVELNRAETLLISRHRASLLHLGFEIDDIGSNAVMLSAVPEGIAAGELADDFRKLLARLMDELESRDESTLIEKVAKAACTAAVKAHDRLTREEALALIAQMGQCDVPFSCPHGRPTVLLISLRELEKRFGRI